MTHIKVSIDKDKLRSLSQTSITVRMKLCNQN